MMAMLCYLNYSSSQQWQFELPDHLKVFELKSPPPLLKVRDEIQKAVSDALLNPYGLSLKELFSRGEKILIVVDDHTRGTPAALVCDFLLKQAEMLGVSKERLTVLIALGTHRPMTQEELKDKLGHAALSLRVVQHDAHGEFTDYGERDGIAVRLNPLIAESDVLLAIGSIVPHRFCGWAGGAKILCPGVCAYETIAATHRQALLHEKIHLGMRENWFRSFMDWIGETVHLDFLVNFVPGLGGYHSVHAGEPGHVTKEGIDAAMKASSIELKEKVDCAIISPYPSIRDLWQSGKGFYIGETMLKDKGTLILATPLEEGIGDHPAFIGNLPNPLSEIKRSLEDPSMEDPLALSVAYATRKIADQFHLVLVTPHPQVQNMKIPGVEIFSDLQEAVKKEIVDKTSSSRAIETVALVQDGYVLPYVV